MSQIDTDEQEEKPLDPVMENVRRKMVRLQLVSAGIMLVMFMAVLGAIVYKVTRPDPRAAVSGTSGVPIGTDRVSVTAALPAGFAVSDVSLSGGQVLFYGTATGGEKQALVFDIATGQMIAEIAVK